MKTPAIYDLPCASDGLRSYRARSCYGWIMIGAKDHADAMREAKRSSKDAHTLQVWNGIQYVHVKKEEPES